MSEVQQMIRSVVPRISSVDQQLRKVNDTQEQIRSRADEVIRDINSHMDTYLAAIQQHRQQLLQQVGVLMHSHSYSDCHIEYKSLCHTDRQLLSWLTASTSLEAFQQGLSSCTQSALPPQPYADSSPVST